MSRKQYGVKCAAAVMAFLLVFQPGTAHATEPIPDSGFGYYEYGGYSDYPEWDDPYYNGYYYYDEDRAPRLKNITRTYDDGTKYVAEYKYSEQGYLTYANIREPDGDKTVLNRTYQGESLVSLSNYTYSAKTKKETRQTAEFGADTTPTHTLSKTTYGDGTSESEEYWYAGGNRPVKIVITEADGSSAQAECTYDEQGRLLLQTTTESDGSVYRYQYDEENGLPSAKEYDYDGRTKVTNTKETYYGEDGASYEIAVRLESTGEKTQTETWYRDRKEEKTVTLMPDGTQYTEAYAYDKDGNESLYTKTGSDGSSERREYLKTATGEKTIYSDSAGNSSTSSTSYDEKTGAFTEERTRKSADGSSSYYQVVSVDYSLTYTISRNKDADGTETYDEVSYGKDGSSTAKQKTRDGVVTVKRMDADGNTVSERTTHPDGTTTEAAYLVGEDGRVTGKLVKYADGTSDRTDYEYDENGDLIKQTETRRNGVVSVWTMTKSERSVIYNNGYQAVLVYEDLGNNLSRVTVTYATGEIAGGSVEALADGGYRIKTVYRNGEEQVYTFSGEIELHLITAQNVIDEFNTRYWDYLEEAWNVIPE